MTNKKIFKCESEEESSRRFIGIYQNINKRGRYGEKILFNSSNGLYLYKARRNIYVLGPRCGGRSIVAYTYKNIGESGWYVYKSTNRRNLRPNFNYDETFKIFELELNRSDVEYPEAIVIYSRYGNVDGGYRKTNQTRFNAPVYYNEEDSVYLYRLENEWALAPSISNYYIYTKSSIIFNDEPPQDANWKKTGLVVKKCEEIIEDDVNSDIDLFEDKDFDAVPSSIGISDFRDAEWVRATQLHNKNSVMKLFNMVEPNDIIQGSVGSCWLLCALAALAEFPSYFENNIFKTKEISENGKYEMNIYNSKTKEWEIVSVDDRIPCTKKSWFRPSKPLFAKPHENEMYILLLEKAFAKLAGSYEKISGGYPVLAWLVLTGCENLEIWSKNSKTDKWGKNLAWLNREEPFNFQKLMAYRTGIECDGDETFKYIKDCDIKNYVMGASISGNVMEKQRDDGLVERHAYSLLSAYEDESIKLVCLRNPWGNEIEWNGDWSDESHMWRKHPDIAQKLDLERKDDGLFWMSWEDFNKTFNEIQICCKSMPTQRSKFADHIDNQEV